MNSTKLFFRDWPLHTRHIESANKTLEWLSTDTKSLYDKNVKSNCITYKKDITYKLNSLGYRCNELEFKPDDFNLITIGCSIPQGIGVSLDDTYAQLTCNHIEQLKSVKVNNFNLSLEGSGIDYAYRTLLSTKKMNAKAFLVSISYMPRIEVMLKDNNGTPHIISSEWDSFINNNIKNAYYSLYTDDMIMYNTCSKIEGMIYYAQSINVPIILLTVDWLIYEALKNTIDITYVGEFPDLGRDCMHPGSKYHKNVSDIVLKQLSLKGVL